MSSRLENLPTEILIHIFDSIDTHKHAYNRRTFISLTLTSKRCRSLAIRRIFCCLFFHVASFEQLKQELNDCAQTLSRLGCSRDVELVRIEGRGSDYGAEEGAKLVELLAEFPNSEFLRICIHEKKPVTDSFYSGVERILGARNGYAVTSTSLERMWCYGK